MLARHVNLLLAAAENVARNAPTYAVAASGLLLGLTVLLSGIALSEGLKAEALESVGAGADVYCTWDRFGRDEALPAERVAPLGEIEGVTRVVPRVIGRVPLGEDRWATLVGVPLASLRGEPIAVEGALPDDPGEVLVGAELAREFGLRPGRTLMLEGEVIRLFKVAGIASRTASLWSARAIVCDIGEAAIVFDDRLHVTDACLYTLPGYADLVAGDVERLDSRYRTQTRDLVRGYVLRGMTLREGGFTALYLLALVLAIPSFAVVSYLGHTPRRREIGLLKADGWSTLDVLEMVALENLLVSAAAGALSLLLALLWVKGFHAALLAPYFFPGVSLVPAVELPARFAGLPAALAFLFSLVVTMAGSIPAGWRTASARPVDALR